MKIYECQIKYTRYFHHGKWFEHRGSCHPQIVVRIDADNFEQAMERIKKRYDGVVFKSVELLFAFATEKEFYDY